MRLRRLLSALGVVVLAVVAAGCGSTPLPPLSNAQIERWLTAVQALGSQPSTSATCFLLTRAELPAVVAHPTSRWIVEGYNDQMGDGGGFAGCGVRAAPGGPGGDGEIGIELSATVGRDPDRATRTVALPGTRWALSFSDWPGTRAPSSGELRRLERAVMTNVAAVPGDPAGYASPAAPFA